MGIRKIMESGDYMTEAEKRVHDRLLGRGLKPGDPGFGLAWIKDGKLRYQRTWGRASLELPAPFGARTVVNAGSIAKQFVAACIHHLELAGKLDLDHPLRRHLPDLPAVFAPIKLRHLLWHTSGIRCYTTLLWWGGAWSHSGMDRSQALELLSSQKYLDFKPGTRYRYGNSNYLLLTEIVRRVSGEELGSLAQRLFFGPLGLEQTHFKALSGAVVPGLAQGHWVRNGAWSVNSHPGSAAGVGRLMTSLSDLVRWAEVWQAPPSRFKAVHARMQARGRLDDGSPVRYGSGLMHQTYRGLAMVRHDGFSAGYRTDVSHFPGQGSSLVAVANRTDISPSWKIRQMSEYLWRPKMTGVSAWPSAREDRPKGRPEGQVSRRLRVGLYKEEGAERYFELLDGGTQVRYASFVNGFDMRSDRPGGYQGLGSGAIFRLDFGLDGRARLLKQGKGTWYQPLRQLPPTARQVRPIVGDWECAESRTRLRFSFSRGRLWRDADGFESPMICLGRGSYYSYFMRYKVDGSRLSVGTDDGWLDRIHLKKRP